MPDLDTKKVFFASDFHLQDAQYTEERLVFILEWLESIKNHASAIYLLGDIFDYWFEYKHVIPKGFTKFLSKLRYLRALNIQIFLLGGNHDIWLGEYFENELDIKILESGDTIEIAGKIFYLHHGDGLGPNNKSTRILKGIFTNSLCLWLFRLLNPTIGLSMMKFFSRKSRENENHFAQKNNLSKWSTYQYAESMAKKQNYDFLIFGHMHAAAQRTINEGKSVYINLGEWISQRSYGVYDGKDFKLAFYKNENGHIHT